MGHVCICLPAAPPPLPPFCRARYRRARARYRRARARYRRSAPAPAAPAPPAACAKMHQQSALCIRGYSRSVWAGGCASAQGAYLQTCFLLARRARCRSAKAPPRPWARACGRRGGGQRARKEARRSGARGVEVRTGGAQRNDGQFITRKNDTKVNWKNIRGRGNRAQKTP